MARQYSLAHLTVLGCAPPEMTYIAARAGYGYVSYAEHAFRCLESAKKCLDAPAR